MWHPIVFSLHGFYGELAVYFTERFAHDELWGLSRRYQPCNMKNRDTDWRRYEIEETLYIGQWCLTPLPSRYLGTSHSSPNRHQLPCRIFPESHWWSEISSLSKVILVLGKARNGRVPNLGCKSGCQITWGIWCFAKKLDMKHDARVGALLWWSCQSPVTHSCSLLNHLNSFHRGMFKLIAKSDGDLFYWLSHFECDSHTEHMVSQRRLLPLLTSTVKSLFMYALPVHSPWLPGYINVAQTVFILTVVWLFPGRPHVHFSFYSRFCGFGFWQFDFNVSSCGSPWIYLGIHCNSWMCTSCFSLKLKNFWPMFLQIFFCPFLLLSGSSTYVDMLDCVPQVS